MNKLNNWLDQLSEKEIEEKEKLKLFAEGLKNIRSIENSITKNEDSTYFDFLIDSPVLTEDKWKFYNLELLVISAMCGKISLEEVLNIYSRILAVEDSNARVSIIKAIRDDNLLSLEQLQNLRTASVDEVNTVLIRQAIDQANGEYIKKNRDSFPEVFSKEFVDFMNSGEFTKEELLEIRNRVTESPSIFVEDNFVVDTRGVVDSIVISQKEIIEQKEETSSEQEINGGKTKLKVCETIRKIFGSQI